MHQRANWDSVLLVVLLACLIGLPTLAYASPPDPTWIAGIYDAGDFDDVVWMLVELCVSDRAPVFHTADVPRASWQIANAISKDLSSVIDLAILPRPPPHR